jgi:hypothetical protein
LLPSSLNIALIAAIQGEARRMNVIKERADAGLKKDPRLAVPTVTLNVLTMVSLAAIPVKSATLACQKPNPNGANNGAIIRPRIASILASASTA